MQAFRQPAGSGTGTAGIPRRLTRSRFGHCSNVQGRRAAGSLEPGGYDSAQAGDRDRREERVEFHRGNRGAAIRGTTGSETPDFPATGSPVRRGPRKASRCQDSARTTEAGRPGPASASRQDHQTSRPRRCRRARDGSRRFCRCRRPRGPGGRGPRCGRCRRPGRGGPGSSRPGSRGSARRGSARR